MIKSHQGSPQFWHIRRFLTTAILPAALAVQAFGVNWNGAVPLNTGDPGLDDVHVLGNSTVTLTNTGDDNIIENSISFEPATTTETLTVNGAGLTLRSLATFLAIANSRTISVNGDGNFAPGSLSTGTAAQTGIVLQKTTGAGALILDDPTNALAGTTLKVVDGLLSIVGSGGTSTPISSLTTILEVVGNSGGTFAPVLRLGGANTPTTFDNRIKVTNNGTIEHISPATDIISGSTLSIESNKTVTFNVTGGGLVVNGGISSAISTVIAGGTVKKTGLGTTLQLKGTTFVQGINAAEGRLEVTGQLKMSGASTIAIGANGTLALLNTHAFTFNRLPATVTVTTGTLEGVPGAFTTATGAASSLTLAGGALTLGPGFNTTPNGLIANLYSGGEVGANAAFTTYNNPVAVTENATINSAAAGLPSLSMSAGKTLTVNGYLLKTGATTLNGAGTYTIDTATQYGQVIATSIIDAGEQIALVKKGAGTLVLEAGANPQLQGAGSSVTVNAGGIGLVLGPVSPLGNATLNANGHDLTLSSKGGDQTFPLPMFTNGGPISARQLGSGVAGAVGTPIRITLTGDLLLNPGKTLNLSTQDNYILALGGISGTATVNLGVGTIETSGVVNIGGPLNVAGGTYAAAQSVSASAVTIADSTVTAPGIASTGPLNITNSKVTANGSLSATNIVIDKSTVTSFGVIATGAGGIQITGNLDIAVASNLNLNGGALTGGPITVQGGVIHAVSGVTTAATTATFTGATIAGLLGRFVTQGSQAGSIWPGNTQAGIFEIEHHAGVERSLTGALSFLPFQAADATISTFFGGVPTEPNQFAIGFFGNFTAPVTGIYSAQVAEVDDDAGFWIDLDGDGVFKTSGANGSERIASRSCCGDGPVGTVSLVAGRTYKVGIAVEDGQGGSSLVGRFGLPGGSLAVVDGSDPAQAGFWSYSIPNQVVVDAGAELQIQALNGAVSVFANGRLALTGGGSSTIESLTIGAGGIVAASHSLSAGTIKLTGGTLTGSSSITVAAGFSLTNSTLFATGAISAASITAIGSTLTSFGAITTGPGGITIDGTSSLQLNGSTISGGPISVNGGTVKANSGVVTFNGSYTQTAGGTVLNGGDISTTTILNLTGGTLTGSGTITGNVFNDGIVAPGFSAGTINIAGDLSLGSDSQFVLEIGGANQGTDYDFVSETGSVPLTLGGFISVIMRNSFLPDPLQIFTVLSSNQPLLGQFSNAASGSKIFASDGETSFRIFYGAGSPFSPNAVVLRSDRAVPEPGLLGLLMIGALGVLGRRPRRGQPLSHLRSQSE